MGLWHDTHARTIDPQLFRAHDQYLQQVPDFPYRATVEHIRSRGLAEWLSWGEDGSHGCMTADVDGQTVSRDLLDSILEIAFLRDSLPGFFDVSRSIVDVGAGYGRFAHRMHQVYPNAYVYCTDDVDISMQCARAYLRHRGVGVFRVLERELLHTVCPLDLAVNIHSWSECTLEEIDGWVLRLGELNVPRIFVVPHDPQMLSYKGPSYRPVLERYGYKLTQQWHGPECRVKAYYLWERS